MPKLGQETFYYHPKGLPFVHVNVDAYVSSGGEFQLTLPEDMVELAKTTLEGPLPKWLQDFNVSVGERRGQRHNPYVVYGPNLNQAKRFFQYVFDLHNSVKTESELVIVYRTQLRTQAFRAGDGTLHACGAKAFLSEEQQDGGDWEPRGSVQLGDSPFDDETFYSVGVYAHVLLRHRHTRGDQVGYTWERPHGQAYTDMPEPAKKLNSFIGFKTPDAKTLNADQENPPEQRRYGVMPYTDEVATFFHRMLISLCEVAQLLRTSLQSPESVKALADRPGTLLKF